MGCAVEVALRLAHYNPALGSLNGDNNDAACNQVNAFVDQVHARSARLAAVRANRLPLSTTNVQGALG
jgi:hypothetical protein